MCACGSEILGALLLPCLPSFPSFGARALGREDFTRLCVVPLLGSGDLMMVVLRFLRDGCEGVVALEKQDMRAEVAMHGRRGERRQRGPFALSLCLVILTSGTT